MRFGHLIGPWLQAPHRFCLEAIFMGHIFVLSGTHTAGAAPRGLPDGQPALSRRWLRPPPSADSTPPPPFPPLPSPSPHAHRIEGQCLILQSINVERLRGGSVLFPGPLPISRAKGLFGRNVGDLQMAGKGMVGDQGLS